MATIDLDGLKAELAAAEAEMTEARRACDDATARKEAAAARLAVLQDLVRLAGMYTRGEAPEPLPL